MFAKLIFGTAFDYVKSDPSLETAKIVLAALVKAPVRMSHACPRGHVKDTIDLMAFGVFPGKCPSRALSVFSSL